MYLEDEKNKNNKNFDILKYLVVGIGNNLSYILIFTFLSIFLFFTLIYLNKTYINEVTIPISINLENSSVEKYNLLEGNLAKFNDQNYKKKYIINKFNDLKFFYKNFYHLYPNANERDIFTIFDSIKFYNSTDLIELEFSNDTNLIANLNQVVSDPNLIKYDLKKILTSNLDQINIEIIDDVRIFFKNQINTINSEIDFFKYEFHEKNKIAINNLEVERKYYYEAIHNEFEIYLKLIEHNLNIAYELGYEEPLINNMESLKLGFVSDLNLEEKTTIYNSKVIHPFYLYGTQILNRELEYLRNLDLEQYEPLSTYTQDLKGLKSINYRDTLEVSNLLINKQKMMNNLSSFNKLVKDKESIFIKYYIDEIKEKNISNINLVNFVMFLLSGIFLGIIIAIFKHAMNNRNITWVSEIKFKL